MAETDFALLDPNQDQAVTAGPALSPALDLPDVHGSAVTASAPAPELSLPDTSTGADGLPAASQGAPVTDPSRIPKPGVSPIAARPGDPDQRPIYPEPQARPATAQGAPPAVVGSNPIAAKAYQMAQEAGLPASTVVAILKQESNFNPSLRPVGKDGRLLSSAFGIGQLLDDERRKYGIGDSTDPHVQLAAVMQKMKDTYTTTKQALGGREPTAAEMYTVYYQGAGAGPKILQNPSASLMDTLNSVRPGWKSQDGRSWGQFVYDSNPWLAQNGIRSNAQFTAWAGSKVQDTAFAAGGAADYKATRLPFVDTAPGFAPAGTPAAAVEQNKIAAVPDDTSLWQAVQASAAETATARIFQQSPYFTPVPGYAPTSEELEVRKQGLPEKFWGNLLGVSPAHSDYLTAQAHRQFENEQTLANAGWSGVAVDLLVNGLDPTTLAIGAASGGLGSAAGAALKFGRVGQRAAAAAGGALGNVATVGVLDATGRTTETSEYAHAAMWGSLLGFAFGPVARNPATSDIAAKGVQLSREAETRLARGGAGDLGAAANPDNTAVLSTHGLMDLAQGDVSRTGIETGRVDLAGRLGASENPATRALGEALGTDAVGRRGSDGLHVVNPIAADQDKARFQAQYRTQVMAEATPAFKEWADARGVSRWARGPYSKAWSDFGEEVNAFIRDELPAAEERYSPQAVKIGNTIRDNYRQQLQDNKNPLWRTGGEGRPLPGLENVGENPFYSPRIYSLRKIEELRTRLGGDLQMIRLFEGAIRSKMPELEEDILHKIASGMYRNHRSRSFGLMERGMMLRNGAEPDLLRTHLIEDVGLSQADADRAVTLITAEKAGVPFAKRKFDLDESFELPNGVKFSDMLETNAFALYEHYTNSAQAWAALGRVRVADSSGKLIVNGIRSVPEFEGLLHAAKARGVDAGLDAKRLARDESDMRELFDRIRGVPHEAADSTWGKSLELVRNYNLARLGGSFGLAQLMDFGNLMSLGGLRAFVRQIPDFRRIVDEGVLTRGSALGKEVQALGGFGADDLRGFVTHVRAEMLEGRAALGTESRLDRALETSRRVSDFVMHASGMHYLTAVQQVWAGQIIAQKFSDIAGGAVHGGAVDLSKISTSTLNRMKFLGLDDGMLKRVLTQFSTHQEVKAGFLGERVNRMNLDKWTDPSARQAFEGALFRLARKAIQENDIGLQTPWSRSPLFRSVMQLRQFVLTAWHNNTLHNLNMRDGESLAHVTATLFSAAVVYAAQVRLQAATERDPDKFLKERLAPGAFSAAVFQRSAFSSILPTIADTAISPFADPIFNYRTSGQPSNVLLGNPSMGLMNDIQAAGQGLLFPIFDGRPRSQQEYKAMMRVLPLQNFMPIQSLFSTMVSGAPQRTPKSRDGHSPSTLLMNFVD